MWLALCSVVSVTPVKTAPSNPGDFWNVGGEEGVALGVIKEEVDDGVGSMDVDKTTESAEVEQMDAETKEESCDIVTGQSDVNMEESGGQLEEDTVLKIVQCLEELRKCIDTSQHTIVSDCEMGVCMVRALQPELFHFYTFSHIPHSLSH